jgi:hypothetical protein
VHHTFLHDFPYITISIFTSKSRWIQISLHSSAFFVIYIVWIIHKQTNISILQNKFSMRKISCFVGFSLLASLLGRIYLVFFTLYEIVMSKEKGARTQSGFWRCLPRTRISWFFCLQVCCCCALDFWNTFLNWKYSRQWQPTIVWRCIIHGGWWKKCNKQSVKMIWSLDQFNRYIFDLIVHECSYMSDAISACIRSCSFF